MSDSQANAAEFPFMGEVEAKPGVVSEFKRGAAALRAVAREFREAVERHGDLIPMTTVAEVMGISYQAVQNYIARGRLDAVDVVGKRWVVAASAVRLLEEGPRKGGRPKKPVAVQVGEALADAAYCRT